MALLTASALAPQLRSNVTIAITPSVFFIDTLRVSASPREKCEPANHRRNAPKRTVHAEARRRGENRFSYDRTAMIAEFRGFLTKTNALALAVGVIIGAAVGNVVSALAADLLMPVIGLFLPG